MENTNRYKFFAKIALEYRLSLENVCRLMKIEPTEDNKRLIYDAITSNVRGNYYQYLFNYETLNEPKEISSNAYRKALIFLTRYVNAKKRNNEQDVFSVLSELTKTDSDFKSLVGKKNDKPLTEEEALIISKYRIKYSLPRVYVCDILGFGPKKMTIGESQIKDEIIKKKIEELSLYCDAHYRKDLLNKIKPKRK